ncbi:MAG: DNA helicase RecQ [Candidatus Uhrbacteria bacterium]
MLKLLKTHFGYDAFRPLQAEIIDTVLNKKDALVLMPTGGGKSLCFQLPALIVDGVTVVISPLIALMKDQVDSLTANGIPAAFLNSTLNEQEMYSVQARALSGELKILYLAPERLVLPAFQDFLERLDVGIIAIDEAHCISEWGHDFRPDYRHLKKLRHLFPTVPVIALTATATPQVREDILNQLEMRGTKVFVSSFNRPNLHYTVQPKYNSFDQLIQLLKPLKNQPAIIYCFSRKDTESLANDLCRAGFPALPYHAGLERELRKHTQDQFIRDEVSIIVATIAFGMGIDKPDVRLVAHMDLPKTIESYYQETGRAGRDGLPSDCVLFYTFGDKRKQEYFINQIENDQERAFAQAKLEQIVDYCESSTCRRQTLLQYFGETWKENKCQACDNCVSAPQEIYEATETAQKILSAVLKTGERFGVDHLCNVLRGTKRKRVLEYHHDTLSVYGVLHDLPAHELSSLIRFMQRKGYLEKNEGEYPTLRVSQFGKTALLDRAQIFLPKVNFEQKTVLTPATSKDNLAFEPELFEKLRLQRKIIADKLNVPPFIIFGDRTLQEMAYYLPQSLESLAKIFGVGARKLEEYGSDFLHHIKTYAQNKNLVEHPQFKQVSRVRTPSVNRTDSTFQKTKELLDKKYSVAKIAHERGMAESTITQHIIKLFDENPKLDIEYLRPDPARLEKIKAACKKADTFMLGPVKAILGDEFSYEEIRLARLFL